MPGSTIAFNPIAGFWKVVMLFSLDRDGWSEVYYFPQASTGGAAALANSIADARVKVLGAGAVLSVIRVSDTGVPRSGYKFLIGRNGQAGSTANNDKVAALADQCSAAVGIPFRAGNGQRRFSMVSGVPDDWIIRDNANDYVGVSVQGKKFMDDWKKWLLQAPWPLQIRERTPPPGNPLVPVTSVNVGLDGYWQIVTQGNPPWTQGQQLALLGFKGTNVGTLRGVKKVRQVIQPGIFEINVGPASYLGAPVYLGGGAAQANTYTMTTALDTGESYLITTRRRGRPFSARRGRSSARR